MGSGGWRNISHILKFLIYLLGEYISLKGGNIDEKTNL